MAWTGVIPDDVQQRFEFVHDALTRSRSILELPELDRDIYLVLSFTENACSVGVVEWLYHNRGRTDWIDASCDAFCRLGHPEMSKCVRVAVDGWDRRPDFESCNAYEPMVNYLWDNEDAILESLVSHATRSDKRRADRG